MTCRYLTSKVFDTANGDKQWAYGYVCGKPTLCKLTTACEDHLWPRRSWPSGFMGL